MDKQISTTQQLNKLIEFRQAIYDRVLLQARDTQFELIEALLEGERIHSFPELSLSGRFQRQWHSSYTAIDRGKQAEETLLGLVSQQMTADETHVLAIDTTVWPHPQAQTLCDLFLEHSPTKGVRRAAVRGHIYSTLSWVPETGSSWALPLSNRRMQFQQTPIEVAVEQIKELFALEPGWFPVFVGDGHYGSHLFLGPLQHLSCAVVTKLAKNRNLYKDPGGYAGFGRPRKHGHDFAFREPETWGLPDEEQRFHDERFGQVRLRCWDHLHGRKDAETVFSVILAETHLENADPDEPLWLAFQSPQPTRVTQVWQWYQYRWSIEPSFRFRKQDLHWTKPQFLDSRRCDTWTLLVDIAFWCLFLAKDLVPDQPFPWQKKQVSRTPGRVLKAFKTLFRDLGSLSLPPKVRGKSPGWPQGKIRSRPERFLVIARTEKQRQNYQKRT
jgi:hypothetical protein